MSYDPIAADLLRENRAIKADLARANERAATWKRRFDDVHKALGCDDATVTEVIEKANALREALRQISEMSTYDENGNMEHSAFDMKSIAQNALFRP